MGVGKARLGDKDFRERHKHSIRRAGSTTTAALLDNQSSSNERLNRVAFPTILKAMASGICQIWSGSFQPDSALALGGGRWLRWLWMRLQARRSAGVRSCQPRALLVDLQRRRLPSLCLLAPFSQAQAPIFYCACRAAGALFHPGGVG